MNYLIIVLGLLLVVSSTNSAPVQWPSGSGGNDHYYEAVSFTDAFLSWAESRDEADAMTWHGAEGHLATMNSAEENAWVWANLGQPHAYYLGGYQEAGSAEPGSGWRWVTDETWIYTFWAIGEPNNAGSGPSGVEDCLQFYGANGAPGNWNDADMLNIPVGGAPGYIVEYEYAPVDAIKATWGAVKALYQE